MVCAPRKGSMSSSATPAATPSISSSLSGRSDLESGSKLSQQILPLERYLVVVHPSPRDRSRSENEIIADKLLLDVIAHIYYSFDWQTLISIYFKGTKL